MTIDPTTPALLFTALPRDSKRLSEFLLSEHEDRESELGCAWWRIVRESYEGTGGFARSVAAVSSRDGGRGRYEAGSVGVGRGRRTYLTPFRRESPESFTARADRSAYQNHVAPVIDVYHGHLVRRQPKRTSTADLITGWWPDVDGAGHDIGEWIAGVALRAQLYGWCAALVDRPDTTDASAVRTTVTALDPSEVRDWQVGLDGRLDWVRLVSEWEDCDPATGEEVEYLEATIWTRTEWARVTMVEGEDNQYVEVSRNGATHSLGSVPLRILRWQEQVYSRSLYGLSQVQGVVPLALALFGNESELTDHLANANFSILAVQSDDPGALANLAIGTNNGVRYGTQEAAPTFVSPGSDVALQYALRSETLRAAIYTAAKMEPPGAKASGGDAASGIAKAYDFSQTEAGLQTFARQLTRFEYELVGLVAAWDALGDAAKVADVVAATTIVYPTRYDAAGIQNDLGAMFAALDDKVRPQMPPAVVRDARLGVARGLFPEASAAAEADVAAQVDAMYAADLVALEPVDHAAAAAMNVADAVAALPLAAPGALTSALAAAP